MLLMTKAVCVCLAEFELFIYDAMTLGTLEFVERITLKDNIKSFRQGVLWNDEMRFCWQGIQEGGFGANKI